MFEDEDLSSGLQNPHEIPGEVVHGHHPSYGKAKVSGSLGHHKLLDSRFGERLVSKHKMKATMEMVQWIKHLSISFENKNLMPPNLYNSWTGKTSAWNLSLQGKR